MNPLIRAERLSVSYGRRVVLESVSLIVCPGDAIAVTGRSGSGKTTLLLALAALIPPTAGSVELAEKSRVVYVPQAPSLIDELTALENVVLALRLRGTEPDAVPKPRVRPARRHPAAAEDRARHELDALGIAAAADALPAQLSGGMQQRTALARALAVDPAALLVDEPTGSLDRATGTRVLDQLLHRCHLGCALVVATHDPAVADRLGTQFVLEGASSAGRT